MRTTTSIQEFPLSHLDAADGEFSEKLSSLFNHESAGKYSSGQAPRLADHNSSIRDNTSGNRAIYFDQVRSNRAHEFDFGSPVDKHSLRLDAATQFSV